MLDGDEIADPEAWLARVAYRRAIDEHRARGRLKRLVPGVGGDARATGRSRPAAGELAGVVGAEQRDFAERLDDRTRLRHVFEALRTRLSVREREAATLCYLQGLSRAEAAARMGVSERRMHKLMDGRGDGAPGVAQKVGALVATIDAGRWCEEQGSLMRGFAYGILEPGGERHRLAEAHRAECPACRAYVLSLRGLAAVLPPVPSLLHLVLGAGATTLAGGSAGASGSSAAGGGSTMGGSAGSHAAGGAGGASTGVAAPAGSVVGGGALSASGAAGVAGGSWWLAGPIGAKLAVGCLLALGVGAGCVVLGEGSARGGRANHHLDARASRAARMDPSPLSADEAQRVYPAPVSPPAPARAASAQAPVPARARPPASSGRSSLPRRAVAATGPPAQPRPRSRVPRAPANRAPAGRVSRSPRAARAIPARRAPARVRPAASPQHSGSSPPVRRLPGPESRAVVVRLITMYPIR